jgi:hypothetical protein
MSVALRRSLGERHPGARGLAALATCRRVARLRLEHLASLLGAPSVGGRVRGRPPKIHRRVASPPFDRFGPDRGATPPKGERVAMQVVAVLLVE